VNLAFPDDIDHMLSVLLVAPEELMDPGHLDQRAELPVAGDQDSQLNVLRVLGEVLAPAAPEDLGPAPAALAHVVLARGFLGCVWFN